MDERMTGDDDHTAEDKFEQVVIESFRDCTD